MMFFFVRLTLLILLSFQSLAGQVLILNAGSEIGRAVVDRLKTETDLILTARQPDKLAERTSGKMTVVSLDFRDKEMTDLKQVLLTKGKGCLDAVVVIPAPQQWQQADIAPSAEDWERNLQSAFLGPLEALKLSVPYLRDGGKIVIVNGITSLYSMGAYPDNSHIGALWKSTTKALSFRLASRSIHVNALAFNIVDTQRKRDAIAAKAKVNGCSMEEQRRKTHAQTPFGRAAKVEEAASAIAFFTGSQSDYITGTNLAVDGGLDRSL